MTDLEHDLVAALKAVVSLNGHNDAWDWLNDPKTKEQFDAAREMIARAETHAAKLERWRKEDYKLLRRGD